jgi:hypothetical protein
VNCLVSPSYIDTMYFCIVPPHFLSLSLLSPARQSIHIDTHTHTHTHTHTRTRTHTHAHTQVTGPHPWPIAVAGEEAARPGSITLPLPFLRDCLGSLPTPLPEPKLGDMDPSSVEILSWVSALKCFRETVQGGQVTEVQVRQKTARAGWWVPSPFVSVISAKIL